MFRTIARTFLLSGGLVVLTLALTAPKASASPSLQNPTPTLVPPVATPTSQIPPPAATPTSQLPPPAPTAVPPPPPSAGSACAYLRFRVPDVAIQAALANPRRIGGFEQARNPNKPASPLNPPRIHLSLRNPNVPYHPIFNRLTWVAGCPWSAGWGARPPR